MQQLNTRQGLDGYVHLDNSWDGNFRSALTQPNYVAATGTYNMSRWDGGDVLTNAGASAASTTTFVLPAPQNGVCTTILKAVKNSTIVIKASGGAAILGGTTQGAANGTATDSLATTFSFAFLQCDGVNWYMMANVGTWAIA